MATLRPCFAPASGPVYETVTSGLRPLDPTEHNMERLNARARGANTPYAIVHVRGPLERAVLERAVETLTDRHPMLRVRIAQLPSGELVFVPTRGDRHDGTARVPIAYLAATDWRELVEADMNAGGIDSARGPLFALAVLDGDDDEHVLVMIAHHAVSDAASLFAVLDELLAQIAEPHAVPARADRSLIDPYTLPGDVPDLAAEVRGAIERGDIAAAAELRARLEAIELELLGRGAYAAALKPVQGWIGQLAGCVAARRGVIAERDLGTSAERCRTAGTGVLRRTAFDGVALGAAAKQHRLTLHAVLSAAVLRAHAERNGERAPVIHLDVVSAVNLRGQFTPPLDAADLRMAVDVAVATVPIAHADRFWAIAARCGEQIRRAIDRRRSLASWFRTERRDLATSPPGAPIVLLSNVGRIPLRASYGALRVTDASIAMTTHGSFQIGILFGTFGDALGANFYFETPTVSRASAERFADTVVRTLAEIAAGGDPQMHQL
jgi:hypothetical protein